MEVDDSIETFSKLDLPPPNNNFKAWILKDSLELFFSSPHTSAPRAPSASGTAEPWPSPPVLGSEQRDMLMDP